MSEVFYQIRWRLIYSAGPQLDEAPNGSTIMDRRPNPVELQLINHWGTPRLRIPIPPGHKPIFYRQRSITQAPNGEFGKPEMDATIFGYGREAGSKMNGKLWVWRAGQAESCPQAYVAPKAIELQLRVA